MIKGGKVAADPLKNRIYLQKKAIILVVIFYGIKFQDALILMGVLFSKSKDITGLRYVLL